MILIIDGHSIAYRAYYKTPPLSNSKGFPTGVIHTFLNTVIKLQNRLKPEHIIVAFDSKGETERHRKLEKYKAERQPSPEDLIIQVEELKNILPLMGVPVYAIEGYEADDIIYMLSQIFEKNNVIVIITKDKDILQLVNNKLKIYDDQKEEFIDIEGVFKKFGVYPEQIPDYLALVGDASDNIPGVKGIGPKLASQLLNKYKTLDNIYSRLDEINSSIRSKLEVDGLEFKNIRMDENELKKKLNELELYTVYNRLFQETYEIDKINGISKKDSLDIKNAFDILVFIDGCVYEIKNGCSKNADKININNFKYFYDFKNIYKQFKLYLEELYDLMIISWLNDPDSKGLAKSRDESIDSFIAKIIERFPIEVEELYKKGLYNVYNEIEKKIIYVLADMEQIGIKVDKVKLQEAAEEMREIRNSIEEEIVKYFGYSFNLNSPKQLSEALFQKLHIKPVKKTKTGLSTSEDSLKEIGILYIEHRELIEKILYYREVNKLLTTYTTKLIENIDETGRIHTEYKQMGTATGRVSSINPNLQNIPQKGELAKNIRAAFISEDNCYLVSFDYSQIELRVLAHLSADDNLINAFLNNLDIHDITARTIFNIEEGNNVPPANRRIAKAVNFGIIYGLSPYGLSKEIGVTQREAKLFIDKYFAKHPGVKKYLESIKEKAKKTGYTETITGRKRYIKDINSRNFSVKQRAERIAINAPLQGSAADIIKIAMLKATDYIKSENIKGHLVLQIHDELIFEVEKDIIYIFKEAVEKIMENVVKLRVPLKVNVGFAENLGELKA